MTKHVIIGGDAAGMSAAMQIRRTDKDAQIWAFEMGETFSYAQCGLPYYIGERVSDRNRLIARTEQAFNEEHLIMAKSLHKVIRVDPMHKSIRVLDIQQSTEYEQPYDKLLIATGASPIRPSLPGVDEKGVFFLKTLNDADRIIAYIHENNIQTACIIGAGYIGLEMAENFVERGIQVTMLQRGNSLGGALDEDMAEHVDRGIRKHVSVHLNAQVKAIKKNVDHLVVSTEHDKFTADIVLIAIGVTPNSELAIDAGIRTGLKEAIEINDHMETNISDIYAAGDCALHYHRLKQRMDYIPLGTHANKQGNIAGTNMASDTATSATSFAGVLGTAIFKAFELEVGRTGLSEIEAIQEHIPYRTITTKAADQAGYYPGMNRMFTKLLYHAETYKVLGGQFVGYKNVAKQVDVLATALHSGLTTKQLMELDLAYAPPFATIWSPIQQAARKA